MPPRKTTRPSHAGRSGVGLKPRAALPDEVGGDWNDEKTVGVVAVVGPGIDEADEHLPVDEGEAQRQGCEGGQCSCAWHDDLVEISKPRPLSARTADSPQTTVSQALGRKVGRAGAG